MENNKLEHSVLGAALSWALAIVSWSAAHVGLIAGIAAIVASIYTVLAAKATSGLRRAQRRQVELEIAMRQKHKSKVDDDE